jgi:hypothetical protein
MQKVKHIGLLFVAIAFGYVLAALFGLSGAASTSLPERTYEFFVYGLLAVGLYGSVHGINLGELGRSRSIVVSAVTVGVVGKSIIISAILWLYMRDPIAIPLGIAVAQIDPLSVAAMERGGHGGLSTRARTIIRAWSSFDDPMTVILAIYAGALATYIGGSSADVTGIGLQYVRDMGLNLLFAATIWLFTRIFCGLPLSKLAKERLSLTLLFIAFCIAVYFKLMLGIAVVGLFLRPAIETAITVALNSALYIAAVASGALLAGGVWLDQAIVLGCAAFAAQMLVGYGLAAIYRLGTADRVHIALAQQNGITAIILALALEASYVHAVGVIVPAILIVNGISYAANAAADAWLRRRGLMGEDNRTA